MIIRFSFFGLRYLPKKMAKNIPVNIFYEFDDKLCQDKKNEPLWHFFQKPAAFKSMFVKTRNSYGKGFFINQHNIGCVDQKINCRQQ